MLASVITLTQETKNAVATVHVAYQPGTRNGKVINYRGSLIDNNIMDMQVLLPKDIPSWMHAATYDPKKSGTFLTPTRLLEECIRKGDVGYVPDSTHFQSARY